MGTCHSKNSVSPAGEKKKDRLLSDVVVIFVLGGPGSGKGTQCAKIANTYDCAHISAGDLLRGEVERGTQLGKECDVLMKEGKLVPIEMTLALLQSAIYKSDKMTFLIDGFPRSIEQAMRFEVEIYPCTLVLNFECSDETLIARLMERGKTSGRVDDNADSIRKRLETYTTMSAPVAHFYERQGKCHRISVEKSAEDIFQSLQQILGKYLQQREASNTVQTNPMMDKKRIRRIVFVLGGPGSGKGTQCDRIVAEYGYLHISVGDLLRKEVADGSELGQKCEILMKEGKLVTLEITLDLLKKAIDESEADCYLIDGFPRSVEQAKLFEEEIAPCDCVLFFDCSEEVMLERVIERAKGSGRTDDNPEMMQKRLVTFREVSASVVQYYTEIGNCRSISAERNPDEVYGDVQIILNRLNSAMLGPDQSCAGNTTGEISAADPMVSEEPGHLTEALSEQA